MRRLRRRQDGSRGQAMVEFAMVLPLILVIIFIVISVSCIYALRISAQKAAYDAAKHVAKVAQSDTPLDPGEAQKALHYDYEGSWAFKAFAEEPTVYTLTTGPDSDGTGYYPPEAVTLKIQYRVKNIPGWDVLTRWYGANNANPGFLYETAVGARVVNKY